MKGYEANAAIHEAGEYLKEILRSAINVTADDILYLMDILGIEPEEELDIAGTDWLPSASCIRNRST